MDLLEELKREESIWKQKSRVTWLTTTDLNMKFFHLSTIIQPKRNNIDALKIGNGVWLRERDDIGAHMVDFFQRLYTSEMPSGRADFTELSVLIRPVISEEENDQLCGLPSTEEIKAALDQIGALKAPGPDGMSATFYHFYWSTVKEELVSMVQNFFQSGYLLKQLNHSFLVLLPKTEHPSRVEEYRPTSLCNVVYKVISKILTI